MIFALSYFRNEIALPHMFNWIKGKPNKPSQKILTNSFIKADLLVCNFSIFWCAFSCIIVYVIGDMKWQMDVVSFIAIFYYYVSRSEFSTLIPTKHSVLGQWLNVPKRFCIFSFDFEVEQYTIWLIFDMGSCFEVFRSMTGNEEQAFLCNINHRCCWKHGYVRIFLCNRNFSLHSLT